MNSSDDMLDHFEGSDLNGDVWIPHYLPQWSSRAETAATYEVAGSELRLTIPAGQGIWCAEDHDPPLRLKMTTTDTIGVPSGQVMTVLGPIPVEAMSVTLMHEHILLDTSSWWRRPCCASHIALAEKPIDITMIGELRMNPFLNRDNCGLLDADVAAEELMRFAEYGGKTVVDPTNLGIGRDPSALQRISRRTGLDPSDVHVQVWASSIAAVSSWAFMRWLTAGGNRSEILAEAVGMLAEIGDAPYGKGRPPA